MLQFNGFNLSSAPFCYCVGRFIESNAIERLRCVSVRVALCLLYKLKVMLVFIANIRLNPLNTDGLTSS